MNRQTCAVNGCERKAQSANLCGPHAHRLRRYGDPEYRPPVTDFTNVDTSLYAVWAAMKSRCLNPNNKSYPNYGGRGIHVCEAWQRSYTRFIEDMGSRPDGMSLDRLNNDGNYSCGNCAECVANGWARNVVWASRTQQARNTRRNRRITIDGVTKTVPEWAEAQGLKAAIIHDRLLSGWPMDQAVMTPHERDRSDRFLYTKQRRTTKLPASGYYGVTAKVNRFRAVFTFKGSKFDLGLHVRPDEAAWLYDQWVIAFYDNPTRLNFDYVPVPRQD